MTTTRATTLRLEPEAEEQITALMAHFKEGTMNGTINQVVRTYMSLYCAHQEKKVRVAALESELGKLHSLLSRKAEIDQAISDLINHKK